MYQTDQTAPSFFVLFTETPSLDRRLCGKRVVSSVHSSANLELLCRARPPTPGPAQTKEKQGNMGKVRGNSLLLGASESSGRAGSACGCRRGEWCHFDEVL